MKLENNGKIVFKTAYELLKENMAGFEGPIQKPARATDNQGGLSNHELLQG